MTVVPTERPCDNCGAPMDLADGRFGRLLRCSRYPACKSVRALALGISCPRAGCDGLLEESRCRAGRVVFACSNAPRCDVSTRDRPEPTPCPHCSAAFVVRRHRKRGVTVRCLSCDHTHDANT